MVPRREWLKCRNGDTIRLQVRANQESVFKLCLIQKKACCRQYALCDRTDKRNSKIQTRCSCVSVSFMYPHTLLSSSRFCFSLFGLSVECAVQGILGKSVPLLVCMHPVSGPGSMHKVPWWWQLFWEDFCKPLEKWDLNFTGVFRV